MNAMQGRPLEPDDFSARDDMTEHDYEEEYEREYGEELSDDLDDEEDEDEDFEDGDNEEYLGDSFPSRRRRRDWD